MYQKGCQHALIMDGRMKGYSNGMVGEKNDEGGVEQAGLAGIFMQYPLLRDIFYILA